MKILCIILIILINLIDNSDLFLVNLKATSVSTGSYHTCATYQVSALLCWGRNDSQQAQSKQVIQGLVMQISAGYFHTCIIQKTIFQCFGSDIQGQSTVPDQVENNLFLNPDTMISAGFNFTCAIQSFKMKLTCWGRSKEQATMVPYDQENQVNLVSTGGYHVCALKSDILSMFNVRKLKCWGDNWFGQSDLPSEFQKYQVSSVSAGHYHTCAISIMSFKCWGSNEYYQSLKSVEFHNTFWHQEIVAGVRMTCMVMIRKLLCWGHDIGIGEVEDQADEVQKVDLGQGHICVLNTNGKVVCWGNNDQGQANPVDYMV